MKFYEVFSSGYTDGEGSFQYFATVKDAMRAAREMVARGHDATVDRVEISDVQKATIVALANGSGWCASRETIFERN
jgi:hypothetical protein